MKLPSEILLGGANIFFSVFFTTSSAQADPFEPPFDTAFNRRFYGGSNDRKIATFGPLSGELVMKNEKKIIENSPDKVLN